MYDAVFVCVIERIGCLAQDRIGGGLDVNGLHGDGAADDGVDGLVDDTHAASSQFARDLEAARIGREGEGGCAGPRG